MQLVEIAILVLGLNGSCDLRPEGRCVCIPPGYNAPPEMALRARYDVADIVMLATALEEPTPGDRLHRVRVDRVFKGALTVRVVGLETGRETTCWVPLTPGVQYLIYAWRGRDGVLQVGPCSGTAPAGKSAYDLARLPLPKRAGPPIPPKP